MLRLNKGGCLGKDLILNNKYGVYSKKELELQLREGHLTVNNLGTIYGLNSSRMNHVLNSLSISYRNTLEDTRVPDPTVSATMAQVFLGTLLGDGYMRTLKSYGLGHSTHQADYFYHVAECLGPFVSGVGYKKTKYGDSLEFWTYRHTNLEVYSKKFYPLGLKKKCFTPDASQDFVKLAVV